MRLLLAGCVIKNSDGQILLIHRNTEKRKQWELPGGKLESNEKLEDAAIRELKEELGIDVIIKEDLGNGEFEDSGFSINYTWFEAEIISGIPRIMENGFDNLKYFSKNDFDNFYDELSVNVKNFLKNVKI